MHIDLRSPQLLMAVAIIIGSAVVALALFHSGPAAQPNDQLSVQRFNPGERNVYGKVNAPVSIIEFSDYQCPYCASLHPTLKQLVDESKGRVSWEYRHLPLEIHPLAPPAALIAECVTKHAGHDAFWNFTNIVFASQRQLSLDMLKQTAYDQGLTDADLTSCQADAAIQERIKNDSLTAFSLGGSGTPFSVIIYPDNSYKVVPGAVPYEQWQGLLAGYVD